MPLDEQARAAYFKLKPLREKTDLKLKPSKYIKETFTGFDGEERPLQFRYYQVQGVLHLYTMSRFLLGDDCGLGKCVTGDTLVLTNHGLQEIQDLCAGPSPKEGEFGSAQPFKVWTGKRWVKIKSFYMDGERPTLRVRTRYGFEVEGSHKHPLWVRDEAGEAWHTLPRVRVGQYACIERREVEWPKKEVAVQHQDLRAANAKRYALPATITPQLARLIGYIVSEGNGANVNGFTITQHYPESHDDIRAHLKECFRWEGNFNSQNRDTEIQVASVMLRDFLEVTCGVSLETSAHKAIPKLILASPRPVVVEFLRGLFEGDGHALPDLGIEYSSKSKRLIKQLQALLLRFGVVSKRCPKVVDGVEYWRLTIFGDDARAFHRKIGFITSRKVAALEGVLDKDSNPNHDVVPHVQDLVGRLYGKLKEATIVRGPNREKKGSGIKQFGDAFGIAMREVLRGIRNLTYAKLQDLLRICADFKLAGEPEWQVLHGVASRHYFYDPIEEVSKGQAVVMDLEVDHDDHSFVGNGFVNHNTLQTIGALTYVWSKEPDRKVLIVTTKSSVGQWCDEFEKFCHTEEMTILKVQGAAKKRHAVYEDFKAATGPTVMVMGYGSLRQDFAKLQAIKDLVITFDESTAFKNPKTKVAQMCHHMASQANRVWCLTATLIKNNLTEGFGIFSVMLAGTAANPFPGSLNAFLNDYYVMRLQKIGKGNRQIPIPVYPKKGSVEKFRQLIDPFFLGRAKHTVAKDLPPLTIRTDRVKLSKAQHHKYHEALAGLLEIDKTGDVKETSPLTALIYCQQIADHPDLVDCEGDSKKLERLMEILKEGDLADENVIVYTRFRKMVDLLMPAFKKAKIDAVRITGAETKNVKFKGKKMSERDVSMKRFNDPKDSARICCITDAASEAINLQSAKAIIFFDSPWSAGNYLQILGRMIRIGSIHDRVYAIHLACTDTIDEKVIGVLKRKMKLVEAVLGKRLKGEEDGGMDIDAKNDISDLFKMMQNDAKERLKR